MDEDTKWYTKAEWDALTTEERHAVEKNQLFMHLEEAGAGAAEELLLRLNSGKVNGSSYWNEDDQCGCILGTLKFAMMGGDEEAISCAQECDTRDFDSSRYIIESKYIGNVTVVEELAYNISPGQTPENNENARLLRDWTKEWLDSQRVAS